MNTPSHSQTKHSNVGLTSLPPIPVDSTTSAYQNSSLTALESESSTSVPFVRLRNTMQDGGYTIYTTTFTSLKTLFTITTITASPTPTTVTTSIPYLTKTEVITTTFVAHDPADVTATIVTPASKAGGGFRLSKAQIAGIIAGAVGFFAVLAAILIYLILRKRTRNFAPVPPNKIPCPGSDAEMGEDDGHNFRQSIGQAPASTSGSDFVVLPPSGQLRHNTPRVSSSPPTTSSVDIINHSDEGHSTESSSYLSAHESLASKSPDLPVDPLSGRMSQSSRMAYEEEIARLRQEVLSQTDRIRYMDEQMELMHTRSPPPSYRSSRRSTISTQTSRSSLSLPPPLPSREMSH
ncbi:hypothetical protein EV421DRAFT_1735174 [Armillaria borealis]|uniref:Uncharacterized protein n=1 Tax=Armillaria borealis TaxID=47425 RepID=A0AA39JKD0_9AGAR|nr:hypothetical protein EV421DRAFT_1735174 [Armillaria borealis]